jgi:hypothetical protein
MDFGQSTCHSKFGSRKVESTCSLLGFCNPTTLAIKFGNLCGMLSPAVAENALFGCYVGYSTISPSSSSHKDSCKNRLRPTHFPSLHILSSPFLPTVQGMATPSVTKREMQNGGELLEVVSLIQMEKNGSRGCPCIMCTSA